MSSWTESEHTGEATDGQLTANHVAKKELVTLVFSKMVRGVFSRMVENWAEWVTEFHVVHVVPKEVPPLFAEDKGA